MNNKFILLFFIILTHSCSTMDISNRVYSKNQFIGCPDEQPTNCRINAKKPDALSYYDGNTEVLIPLTNNGYDYPYHEEFFGVEL